MNIFDKYTNLMSSVMRAPDDGGGAASSSGEAGGGSSSVAAPTAPADGGGSSSGAPASAPSVEPASDPGAGWANLGSTDDLDYVEIPAQPAPVEPVVPKVPPAQVPQAPPVQEPGAQPAPVAAADPQAGAAGEARPLTAADPWRIAEGLEAHRAEVIAHLAGTKFALSEEDIRELDADAGVAVPKLLSRVFLESQMAMQKFLAQAVPGMIKQYNTVTGANSKAEEQFFKAHKDLDSTNPQHRATAVRIATLYRQANPNIPLDQLIAEVGPMVMASLRINASAAGTQAGQGGRSPALPRGGTPFRPAVNGGGGAPIAAEPQNEWAGLGQNFD